MKKNKIIWTLLLLVLVKIGSAQEKLTLDKVMSVKLQNSGSIMEAGKVKGYYLFYQSDKIDKHTNEYTVQILDQNLNKVKDIKFEDSKDVELMEASFNGSALCFLFHNSRQKILTTRVYSLAGKVIAEYTRELDKKSEEYLKTLKPVNGVDEGQNKNVFDIKNKGFVIVIPLRDGRKYTYEMNYYSSFSQKQWTYTSEEEERFNNATFLGATDSIIFLEIMKKERMMSTSASSSVLALNFENRRKAFELNEDAGKFKFMAMYCTKFEETGQLLLVGPYFNKGDNILKDFSQGLAIYTMGSDGKILTSTYNSWVGDMGKYLNINSRGKLEDIGYLYFQNIIKASNGKIFAVTEGYKRVVDAGGIALNALSMLARSYASAGNTKIKVTDLVMLEFDENFKIHGATIYPKNPNNFHTAYADFGSQHALATVIKALNGFDYAFTMNDKSDESFSVCYEDYEKSSDYKGMTFHSLRYDGKKFKDDKIILNSSATSSKVMPAKTGFISILEYYKKDKRINFRLEKMN